MRETKGEAVSATEWLNNRFTCLQNSAVTGCKRGKKVGLGEVSWRTTMEKQNDSDSISGVSVLAAGTSVPRPELISSLGIASFVGGEAIPVSPPPAQTLWESVTHTQLSLNNKSRSAKAIGPQKVKIPLKRSHPSLSKRANKLDSQQGFEQDFPGHPGPAGKKEKNRKEQKPKQNQVILYRFTYCSPASMYMGSDSR